MMRDAAGVDQYAGIASGGSGNGTLLSGTTTSSNDGVASNDSDGTAMIHTGDADATGNDSETTR